MHARCNRKFVSIFSLFLMTFIANAQAQEPKRLCRSVYIQGTISPDLSAVERRFVCGDPRVDAWKEIPHNQARFHLRNFLQQRGYHSPHFQENEERLVVIPGAATFATQVIAVNAPEDLNLKRHRKLVGQRLTPDLLTGIEQWVYQELQRLGYACPKIKAEADQRSGVIRISVSSGPKQRLIAIREEIVPGLIPGLFRRYDAFQLGSIYNAQSLAVAANRIVTQQVVEGSHFITTCGAEGATVLQEVTAGAPRLLTFGFGVSTEGLFGARAAWRHARQGPTGSWLEVSAFGSTKEQRLDATINWYHLPFPSRRFVQPLISFRHQNEIYYEILELDTRLGYGTTWDNSSVGLSIIAGPSYETSRTFRGIGPRNAHFLFLDTEIRLQNHGFEYYYRLGPREGFAASFEMNLASMGFFSTTSAQRFGFYGEHLINFRDYYPPLWVLGFRGGLFTTLTPERPAPATRLPVQYFHFLGGSRDLRGFSRQELPASGLGALTSGFLGMELRYAAGPWGVEPVGFLDLGALGLTPFSFDPPLYWSPGVGVRWHSPIGVFRTTLAHGFPETAPSHWQFYLSYGEEF